MSKDELATALEQESRMVGDAEDDAREIGVLRVACGTAGRNAVAGQQARRAMYLAQTVAIIEVGMRQAVSLGIEAATDFSH